MAKQTKAPQGVESKTQNEEPVITSTENQNTTQEVEKTETTEKTAPEKQETETTEKVNDDVLKKVVEIIAEGVQGMKSELQSEAEKLMKQHDVKEIWRCPETNYWFTKKENAAENAGKVEKEPEHYKL